MPGRLLQQAGHESNPVSPIAPPRVHRRRLRRLPHGAVLADSVRADPGTALERASSTRYFSGAMGHRNGFGAVSGAAALLVALLAGCGSVQSTHSAHSAPGVMTAPSGGAAAPQQTIAKSTAISHPARRSHHRHRHVARPIVETTPTVTAPATETASASATAAATATTSTSTVTAAATAPQTVAANPSSGTTRTCYPGVHLPATHLPASTIPASTIPGATINGVKMAPVHLPATHLPAVNLPPVNLPGSCLEVPRAFALAKTRVRVSGYGAIDPKFSSKLSDSYWTAAGTDVSIPDPTAPGFGEDNAAGFPRNQYVRSYVRSDGTMVSGYWRNDPSDGLPTCEVISC